MGWLPAILWVGGVLAAPLAFSEDRLASRIDALIEDHWAGNQASPPADDAEFFRRIHLDLSGIIPTVEETRAFLGDSSSDKRDRVVSQLLDGPRYPQRMAEWFHVHFMERLGDDAAWEVWLRESFAQNKPWDRMAREILRADLRDEANHGAAYFYAKRLENYGQNAIDYSGLTRDVGRLFLGMDLQCAECHNHKLIDDYLQADFQGLMAAFQNLVPVKDRGYPAVEERLMTTKLRYASVFTQKEKFTGPRLPGLEEIEVPDLPKDQQYLVAPDKKTKTPGVPRFSPLQEFANRIAGAPGFDANLVNRVWFWLMGRGLVEPLDQFHSGNPPSHPELLSLLASEFAAHGRDFRWLVGELTRTRTYQRSSRLPEGAREQDCPPELYLTALERRLSAEQLLWSTLRATGHQEREVALENQKAPPAEVGAKELPGLRERFRKALANDPRQPELEFAPSLKGALFMMNDPELLRLLDKGDGAVVTRLAALPDDVRVAEELCLSFWSRLPEKAELENLTACLKASSGAGERQRMVRDLAWGMMTSPEFVVNH